MKKQVYIENDDIIFFGFSWQEWKELKARSLQLDQEDMNILFVNECKIKNWDEEEEIEIDMINCTESNSYMNLWARSEKTKEETLIIVHKIILEGYMFLDNDGEMVNVGIDEYLNKSMFMYDIPVIVEMYLAYKLALAKKA